MNQYTRTEAAMVLLYSISSTEISQGGKFYGPINMSVGINMFMNGKLDSSFETFICARLKFQNVCNSGIAEKHNFKPMSMHIFFGFLFFLGGGGIK